MSTTDAISLYDSISNESDFKWLISTGAHHSNILHFEAKDNPRVAHYSNRDSLRFSVAASAFANCQGGVFIWGIARKRNWWSTRLHPIRNINQFADLVASTCETMTGPSLAGIRVDVIPTGRSRRSGYLKCFIPKSEQVLRKAARSLPLYFVRTAGRDQVLGVLPTLRFKDWHFVGQILAIVAGIGGLCVIIPLLVQSVT